MKPIRTSPGFSALRRLGALAVLVGVLAGVLSSTAEAAGYPNDEYYPRQWHLRRIGAPAAWKTTKGRGITIAVVDTGVAGRHGDLRANMARQHYDGVAGRPAPAGDVCPFSPAHRAKICHGTMVAGAAAAVTNNRLGVAGVAPESKIMMIRVSSPQVVVDMAAVTDGVMWAADNGAKVINLSLGSVLPLVPFPWDAAILYATLRGATVVVSSGNEGLPGCSDPASNPAAICVGASDSMDNVARFSNYGVKLDVVAPGTGIWTTTVAGPSDPIGFYAPVPGTSFSAPIVSGIAAQLMAMGANNIETGMIIRQTAKDLGLPGYDLTYGFGRVDAAAAVNLCKQIC